MISVALFSIGIFAIGLATNFHKETSEIIWVPKSSMAFQHKEWIESQSGFPKKPRYFMMNFHANGNNVLSMNSIKRVFQAIDSIQSLPKYEPVCSESYFVGVDGQQTCQVDGVTAFWNDSSLIFENQINSDEEAIVAISATQYPNGKPVLEASIIGDYKRNEDGILTEALSFFFIIWIPDTNGGKELEEDGLATILSLKKKWENEDGNSFRIEVMSVVSFENE
jgi:hypothetical protein